MNLTIVIVDDEPLARERLRSLLATEPATEIIAECGNGHDAVAAVKRRKPDLILLDIQMPELDGFQTLARLPPPLPAVAFVTAHDEHAVHAFDVHALDYLLKPVQAERLRATLSRVRARAPSGDDTSRRILALLEERAAKPEHLVRIAVRDREHTHFVKTADIDWIEASGNYLVLHVGRKNHLLRETVTALEGQLSPVEFFRLNRGVLVNLDRVSHVEPAFNDEHIVVLRDGTRLALTRGLRDLRERLRFA